MLWWKVPYRFVIGVAIVSMLGARASAGESTTAWRPSTRPVSIEPPATAAACGGCSTSLPPAEYREETYFVRRPVVETSMREERYVRYEPVTMLVPQQVDQGAWIDQQVVRPGRTTTRLRWFDGGWTVDPATGREYWRLPMWRPVKVRQPDRAEIVRVWKPNLVTMSVPKVSYQPRIQVRQVPVQTVRYVEERRVRRVPVNCRDIFERLLAPGAAPPTPTIVVPPTDPSPPATGTASPFSEAPAGDVPVPLPALPKPEIDPRENVPGPSILPQSQPGGEGASGPRNRSPERERVALSR
jgi:hypothetical protein